MLKSKQEGIFFWVESYGFLDMENPIGQVIKGMLTQQWLFSDPPQIVLDNAELWDLFNWTINTNIARHPTTDDHFHTLVSLPYCNMSRIHFYTHGLHF